MTDIVLSAAEMRAAEKTAIDAGTSVETLMERAGAAVAEAVWRVAGESEVLVLCGPGNNGGDGYVAARRLKAQGVHVRLAATGPSKAEAAARAAVSWDGPIEPLQESARAPVIVDALFGTGLARALEPATADALSRLCRTAQRRIAVDLPSGVATDTGAVLSDVPRFDLTVALGALKPSHLLLPAAALCGQVAVADIGLGPVSGTMHRIGRPRLPAPGHEANKYSRGKLTLVGGNMPGASRLAALAAQRAGAGYVELVGSDQSLAPYALVCRPWTEGALDDPRIAAVVIGPGLGRDTVARARLDVALASRKPLLLDADALSLVGRTRHDRLAGHVITPHWGEFVRLFGDDGRDRLSQARAAAARAGAIVILKGADSILAHPDGRIALAALAPSWLASAGTGDVLAGVIGSLMARGLDPFDAAQAGLWLHAEAARSVGPMLIADDLIAHLPHAIAACL